MKGGRYEGKLVKINVRSYRLQKIMFIILRTIGQNVENAKLSPMFL